MENNNAPKCGCVCHKAGGVLILLIGLDFLLGNLGVLSQRIVGIAWPVLVMIFGLKKLCKCKCCPQS